MSGFELWFKRAAIAGAVVLLAACTTTPPEDAPVIISGETIVPIPEEEPEATLVEAAYPVVDGDVRFARASFSELPPVSEASWEAALSAFKRSCTQMGTKAIWLDACSNAQFVRQGGAREFFLTWFDPWREASLAGKKAELISDAGIATGYYEPMLRGSRRRHGPYQHPVYRVPDDLIVVDLQSLHPELKGMRLRGKLEGRRLVPYDTREQIARRSDMRRYVLCWADDPVEAFFLQVQGSGRVLLDDGTFMRLGPDDQNGHPYRAIANWLVKNAGFSRSEMSMERIKRWAKENPQRTQELLNANPSFVFFKERKDADETAGPIGSQGVPLTPEASIAVDRRYWPMGMPFVIDMKQGRPHLDAARAVVAQDTGSAIRGVLRFDYFWGYGDAAGRRAGGQKSVVRAWMLMPKGEDPRRRML